MLQSDKLVKKAVVALSDGEVVLLPALVASAAEVITVVRVEW